MTVMRFKFTTWPPANTDGLPDLVLLWQSDGVSPPAIAICYMYYNGYNGLPVVSTRATGNEYEPAGGASPTARMAYICAQLRQLWSRLTSKVRAGTCSGNGPDCI